MTGRHARYEFLGLLLRLESATDPKDVAIWMANVHLADVPWHIGRRKCDLQSGSDAPFVHLVHIVYPNRHPNALVALFVFMLLKRGRIRTAATASLRPLAKEYAFPYPIQPRQRSEAFPSPTISSIPTSQTRRRCSRCQNVQYRGESFDFHNERRITLGEPSNC
jgi:hypothetical protein